MKNLLVQWFGQFRVNRLNLHVVLRLFQRYWVIVAGVIAAALAFWSTQWYAETKVAAERARVMPKGGYVEVLVAARDLSAGDRATAETVAVRRVLADWVLPNSLRPGDFDAVNQQILSQGLPAGHPLTTDHIRQRKVGASPLDLEPGYRAVSISVDEVTSVGGLIQPGDRIDLWAAALPVSPAPTGMVAITEAKPPERRAQMIAENLRVLATGQRTDRTQTGEQSGPNVAYASLTLAVPASVAALVLGGQFQGRLGTALRAGSETKPTVTGHSGVSPPPLGPVEILVGGLDGGTH